jgi:hypothetical protein
MPLCTFSIHATPSNVVSSADRVQNGIASLPYDGQVSAGSLQPATVNSETTISRLTWQTWKDNILTERRRRNIDQSLDNFSMINSIVSGETSIDEGHFNELRSNLANANARITNSRLNTFVTSDRAYSSNQNINDPDGNAAQPGITTFTAPSAPTNLPAAAVQGENITALSLNSIVSVITSANAVCVCNCNYCTCNCNYCTCNCNYSCTCNCNYSDFRLKKNIIFSHRIHGINIYKFSYKWDDKKTYLGVIAQQLFGTKYESAVSKSPKGFYMVDYSKLPIDMKEV